ncbi:MAG: iron-sulfur cluster-binding protein [Deltaproteobacteria bacterium]|nr:iron-sulfur cluster-binding protein [Deltaproteobacteria bacterium]
MELSVKAVKKMAAEAARNEVLYRTLTDAGDRFVALREGGFRELADPEGLRARGRAVKERCLANMPGLLRLLEKRVTDRGGIVHWAKDASTARGIILDLVSRYGIKTVVKGKSMMTEEIALNQALVEKGIEVWETDLGEFIVQLAGEIPSHIIAPAIHMNKEEVARLFCDKLGVPYTENPEELTMVARRVLREKFLGADMGITGGNMVVAETGTLALFENEGNIRMSTSLPKVHVALIGIEKVVETWDDFSVLMTLLSRSAAGQKMPTYLSLITGPRMSDEQDGPEAFHLVLLDNGRSDILGDQVLRDSLFCLRCGACLNVCPVYKRIGGHSYGWVYSGPIGILLDSELLPPGSARDLAFACTLCGGCAEVCPVLIDHPKMILDFRRRLAEDPMWKGRQVLSRVLPMKLYSRLSVRPVFFRIAGFLARGLQAIMAPSGEWRWLPGPFAEWGARRKIPRFKRPFSRRWTALKASFEKTQRPGR